MKTECTQVKSGFQALGKREIIAEFNGGSITSDGGVLLLLEVENRTAILKRFAEGFTDFFVTPSELSMMFYRWSLKECLVWHLVTKIFLIMMIFPKIK